MEQIKVFEELELYSHILTEFKRDVLSDDSIFLTESHGYFNDYEPEGLNEALKKLTNVENIFLS